MAPPSQQGSCPPADARPLSTDSVQDPLDVETFNSQELMVYLNESRCLSLETEDPTDDENPPEEGEEEAEWLRQAGFDSLVAAMEPSSAEVPEAEWEGLVTLSHRQAEVVKRRLHALRDTLQKRRVKERRRPDLRRLFSSEHGSTGGASGGSPGSRSRSATPDSLDSLTPPLTPPETAGRRQSGSPHSQGYHSSSRGSLDRLEAGEQERDRVSEFRHVLRIPVDSGGRPRSDSSQTSQSSAAAESPDSGDWPPRRTRRASRDVSDHSRARPSLSLFETTGNYDLSRPPSSSDSSGIEAVSFQPIGSVRHHSQLARAVARPTPPRQVSRPRVQRARSKPEFGLITTGAATVTTLAPARDKARSQVSSEQRLGRTRLGDLSESDVARVQKLALLELTGLLDEHGLSYSRRKARRRRLGARSSGADSAVLGASLTSLLKRDRLRRPGAARGAVPLAFEKIIVHLERHGVHEEGLLRVPGHRQKIEQLRQVMDERFYSSPAAVDAALQRSSPADAAAVLKQLLRQLPSPLLTDESLEAFQVSDALPDPEDQVQALTLLCLRLPAANRALLRRLLSFLAAIVAQERTNKMSLENVAVIMAPNLIPARRRRQKDITAEIAFASVTSRVVRRLVLHRQRLWEVPAQFVRQVRLQYEQEVYERARRDAGGPIKLLLRRRDTAIVRKIDNEVDFQEGVIRVKATQFGRASWPVRLAKETTAGDLVTRCIREGVMKASESPRVIRRRSVGWPPEGGAICTLTPADLGTVLHTHFLHEHGGNIGERRLEHGAFLLDCYQENPNARWVLHCCHGPTGSAGT